ncbi:MAG: hypothetical protein CSA73_01075 [Rhodobacterales bacterium]|nr:MAG: hypothetical protein CSA73_01075 [Rhodobacterales bacterium]
MRLHVAFRVVFVLAVVDYLVMVLWSLPQLTVAGLVPFDLRPFGYSPDEARAYLAALGPDQRAFYAGVQHRLDLVFPGLMAASLILAYLLLFSRRVAGLASVMAVAAAVFDWCENAAVGVMLREGAVVPDAMIVTASGWTVWKSVAVMLALGIVILGLWQRWQGKRKQA